MPVQAKRRELLSKYLFTVHDMTNGFQTSAFQKCSALKAQAGVATYAEGGSLVKIKEPGMIEFQNVTLTRGVNEDESFHQWLLDLVDMVGKLPEGQGALTKDLLRDLDVRQRDRTQRVRITHPMHCCFPVTYTAGDWDNMTDDVQVEELELAQWFFERVVQ